MHRVRLHRHRQLYLRSGDGPAGCVHDFSGTPADGLRCEGARLGDPDICGDPLVNAAAKLLRKNGAKLVALAESVARGPNAGRLERLLQKATRKLDKLEQRLNAGRLAGRFSPACRALLLELIAEARRLIAQIELPL